MNLKLYKRLSLLAVLFIGSAKATDENSLTVSTVKDALKSGLHTAYTGGCKVAQNCSDIVSNQAQIFYHDPRGYATQVATDVVAFVADQGKKGYELVTNNPGKSVALASGVIATGLAVKYMLPYAGWAYQRAKINGSKLVQKCVITVDPVKQFAWNAVKFATKATVVGTVIAAPVLVAYASQNKEAVIAMANSAQDFVMSCFARV